MISWIMTIHICNFNIKMVSKWKWNDIFLRIVVLILYCNKSYLIVSYCFFVSILWSHSSLVQFNVLSISNECTTIVFKFLQYSYEREWSGNTKGGSITVPLTSCDWFWISCMITDNFCFYLQNRLIQTSQTGGQWYSDTFPFSIPWSDHYRRNYIIVPI